MSLLRTGVGPASRSSTRARSLALPLLLVAACAPPPAPEEVTDEEEDTAGSTEPSIRISWPPPEGTVSGCEIVTVEVDNFRLVEFPADEVVEGEGHYHLYHPGGYEACYKPWCLVDLSALTATTSPYFRVVLADSEHNELLDADGDPYEHQIPIMFEPGTCALNGSEDTGDGA